MSDRAGGLPQHGGRFREWLAAGAGPPGLWRVLIGTALILLGWVGSTVVVLVGAVLWRIAEGAGPEAAISDISRMITDGGPGGTALALATFAGIWLGAWGALSLIHRRDLLSLLGQRPRESDRVLGGLALGLGYYALTVGLAVALVGTPDRTGLTIAVWASWAPVIAALVMVQAGAEEVIFRGYLAQEIARRIRHPIAWAVLPSALFGALHYAPDLPGASGILYAAVTFLFGLAASVLVWRTGGLGAAIGLHAGLNISGLTLAGLEGVISGSQLWLFRAEDGEALFLADLAATLVLFALLLAPPGRVFGRG